MWRRYNYDETLSTLRFADRAKNIKLKPKANEEASLIAQLNKEIDLLKAKLDGAAGVKLGGPTVLAMFTTRADPACGTGGGRHKRTDAAARGR